MKSRYIAIALGIAALIAIGVYWTLGKKDAAPAADAPAAEKEPAPAAREPAKQAASEGPRPQGGPEEVFRDDDPEGNLRLEGQVLDGSDAPVGGALVVIDANPPRTAKSEEDGSFAFDKLLPRTYSVSARKDELAGGPVTLKLTQASEPIAIRMMLGAAVEVTVVTKEGTAVAGASVELRQSDERAQNTDASGVVRFAGVAGGLATLVVKAPGYGVVHEPVLVPEPGRSKDGSQVKIRIVVYPGAPVAGRVVDETGKAVAGARVMATDASTLFSMANLRRDSVTTDSEGRFTTPALAAGTYRLIAMHEAYTPGSSEPIGTDGVNQTRDVEVKVKAGGVIAGTVVDRSGQAVPFASVRVDVKNGGFGFGGGMSGLRQATADRSGAFEIQGLSRSTLRVLAASEQASSDVVEVDLEAQARKDGVVLTLTVEGVIAGVVVNGSGEPVPEAQVMAWPDFRQGEGFERMALRGRIAQTTDGGGRFVLAGLADGEYRLQASIGRISRQRSFQPGVSAKTGDKNVKLVIEEPGTITGKVKLDDGSVPGAFTVTVGFPPGMPVSDESGAFTVDDLVPGTHSVAIGGPGFAAQRVNDVKVSAGQTTDLGTITVKVGRTVSGRVVDAAGSPVAGATVLAARQIMSDGKSLKGMLGFGAEEIMGVKETQSGEDGSFTIIGLVPGELQLIAEHADVGRSAAGKIPAGVKTFAYDLVLRPFGSVRGIVRTGDKPAASAMVAATGKAGMSQGVIVTTGQDGAYAIERLPEGRHRLTATIRSGGMMSSHSSSIDVEIVGGRQTQADLSVKLGEVELLVTIAGKDSAKIDMAQVFLLPGRVAVTTVKELNEIYTQLSDGAMQSFAMDGKSTTFGQVLPGEYSVCILPISGSMQDASFFIRLQEMAHLVKVYCEAKAVAASPTKQTYNAVVPAMEPLPDSAPEDQPNGQEGGGAGQQAGEGK